MKLHFILQKWEQMVANYKMKKLISLLVAEALAITGCATMPKEIQNPEQEKVFRNLGIPVKFLNYKKNKPEKDVKEFGGRLYGIIDYSNRDGKVEVREIYNVISEDKGGYYVEAKPFRYLFEMNKLDGFQDDEILTDDRKDGLNGNERWYEIRIVKFGNDIL